jgi:hypothetical protein
LLSSLDIVRKKDELGEKCSRHRETSAYKIVAGKQEVKMVQRR